MRNARFLGVCVFTFAIAMLLQSCSNDNVFADKLASVQSSSAKWQGTRYKLVDLGTLPGYNWSEADSINDQGQILCTAGIRAHNYSQVRSTFAFIWNKSHLRTVHTPSMYPDNWGISINNAGDVLGKEDAAKNLNGKFYPFLWHDGSIENTASLSNRDITVNDLSNDGDIVGDELHDDPPQKQAILFKEGKKVYQERAFVWIKGKMDYLDLPSPAAAYSVHQNNPSEPLLIAGDVLGNGFFWQEGKVQKGFVAGSWGTHLRAVNSHGETVGWVAQPSGRIRALIQKNSKCTLLPSLGVSRDTSANAINDKGVVVGDDLTKYEDHAVIWHGTTIEDLNNGLTNGQGVILRSAQGINDKGDIICDGVMPNWLGYGRQHAFLLIPE